VNDFQRHKRRWLGSQGTRDWKYDLERGRERERESKRETQRDRERERQRERERVRERDRESERYRIEGGPTIRVSKYSFALWSADHGVR
jgi:hypothetical protein